MSENARMNNGSSDPPASMTVIVGIIGAILLLAVILVTQVLFFNVQRIEDENKLYAARPAELADLQARELAQINTYRYVDREKGVVAIPIDRAIELYADEMKSPPAPTTIPATESFPSDSREPAP
jgi:hypothetical protein